MCNAISLHSEHLTVIYNTFGALVILLPLEGASVINWNNYFMETGRNLVGDNASTHDSVNCVYFLQGLLSLLSKAFVQYSVSWDDVSDCWFICMYLYRLIYFLPYSDDLETSYQLPFVYS